MPTFPFTGVLKHIWMRIEACTVWRCLWFVVGGSVYIYVCVCVRVQRHLSKILNFQSDFDVEGLSTVHQSPTESEMTEMPSKKEVML